MDFFEDIKRKFGLRTQSAFKDWKKLSEKRLRLHEQLKFLLKCRQEGLIPSHLDTAKLCQINISNKRNQVKFLKTLNFTYRKILNIEIDDFNFRIKTLDYKVRTIRPTLLNTPSAIHSKFFGFETLRLSRLASKMYQKHQRKLQILRDNRNRRIHRYSFDSTDFLLTINSQRNNSSLDDRDNNTHNSNDSSYNNLNPCHNTDNLVQNNNRDRDKVDIDPLKMIIERNRAISRNNQNSKGWLVNLSSVCPPPHIELFLSLGHRFCLPYIEASDTKKVIHRTICAFESRSGLVPDDKLDNTRGELTNILSRLNNRSYKKDTMKVVSDTKSFLEAHPEIIVTRADKGNSTVMLNTADYISKSVTLLNDETVYKVNNKDPTNIIQKLITKLLEQWKVRKYLDETTFKILKPDNCVLARMYTLPKIHKGGVPMRPIVSSINNPTQKIAGFLQEVLRMHVGTPASNIKDSFVLKDLVSQITLPCGFVLVSFDVTALYTNVPLNLVLNSIERRRHLFHNKIPVDELKKAIEIIMSSTFFSFNKTVYRQISGLPMGSPLAPILSDMVMSDLEESCLSELDFVPPLYKRYVDDIIIALPADKIEDVLSVFNNYHPKLQFTIEREKDNSIPFLDILLIRQDSKILTNWYRKPTWSGRFINYYSSHPVQQKTGIIYMLVDRALKLSHPTFWQDNLNLIRETLMQNCYPEHFIHRHLERRRNLIILKSTSRNTGNEFNTKTIMNFPFVEQIHYPLLRLLRSLDINLVTNNRHNIGQIVGSTKDKIPLLLNSKLVYRIPCGDCEASYIGQTKRYLKTRIQEHKNSTNHLSQEHTALVKHIKETKHTFNFDRVKILSFEPYLKTRILMEMICIKNDENSVNYRTDVDKLSMIYNSII